MRSVADALAPHCSSMNVPESPFVLHLSQRHAPGHRRRGRAVDDASSLTLAASLHPSAAVVRHADADVADAVIAELEHMDRGRYAGPGRLDGRHRRRRVGHRAALRRAFDDADPSRIRLFAGCGIVAGSDPEAEVAESSAKFVPMRDALTAT